MAAKQEEYFWVSLGALGDGLMLVAMADEALSASQAGRRATLLAIRGNAMLAEIAEGNPRIRISSFSLWPVLRAALQGRMCRVCFPPTFGHLSLWIKRTAWFLSLVPNVRVVGYRDIGTWQPYDETLYFDPQKPVLQNYLALAKAAGIPAERTVPHPVFSPNAVSAEQPYFFIHPFAANLKRTLPPRRWRALIEELHRRYPAYRIMLSGSKEEEALSQEWFDGMPYVQMVMNRPISEIAGYLSRCALFIGVDTGITHVAGFFSVPSVVLENNSNPMWFPVYNPYARILVNGERCTCTGDKGGDCTVMEDGKPYYRCLYDISDSEIFTAIAESLQAPKASAG